MQILALGLGQAGEPAFLSSTEATWITSILTGHHLRSHIPASASFPFMGDSWGRVGFGSAWGEWAESYFSTPGFEVPTGHPWSKLIYA